MRKTDKRTVLKLMSAVREVVQEEISGTASDGGMYARGLASEGRAGGYLQALDDIDAALRHGYPTDPYRYWERARNRLR